MPDSVDFARKSVLVLGASGYIGSRIAAALRRSPVYVPVAASRRSAVRVDATDPASVQAALRDVDCVVNCIAGNDRGMVETTRVLLDAARLGPPRRIVHLSSMAVYGSATGSVNEDHPPVEPLSGYGRAKIECEALVRKYVADGGEAVILRPTCVFGPESPQWTTRIAALLQARRIGDLGTQGDGGCNLAYIGDLVDAVIAALDAPDVSGLAFNVSSGGVSSGGVSSGGRLTWNAFLIAYAKALGATPIRRIPVRRLRMETKLLAPIRKITKMGEAITPSLAALWRQDIHIDTQRARAALSLRPTSVDDMIAAVTQPARVSREHALP